VIWDHSAVGLEVRWAGLGARRLSVGLGTIGVHRFDALATLGSAAPAEVWAAIAGVVEARGQRP
jgi:hypothetical protein